MEMQNPSIGITNRLKAITLSVYRTRSQQIACYVIQPFGMGLQVSQESAKAVAKVIQNTSLLKSPLSHRLR